jgi:hypothetical protein
VPGTLTLALSRFAGEGTPAEQRLDRVPSTAKRERVRVRVSARNSIGVIESRKY